MGARREDNEARRGRGKGMGHPREHNGLFIEGGGGNDDLFLRQSRCVFAFVFVFCWLCHVLCCLVLMVS